jgi:hypothetical protein
MKEEKLKEAFSKIKEDMLNLGKEISDIRTDLLESNQLMKQINEEIIKLKLHEIAGKPPSKTSTDTIKTSTHPVTSTDTSTHPQEIGGLKTPNLDISIGNQGVSTDRQTDKQTVRHILRHIISKDSKDFKPKESILPTTTKKKEPIKQEDVVPNNLEEQEEQEEKKEQTEQEKPIQQQISEASEILDSLDNIKKDIRRKFKRITQQEMLVFSTIYTLEEQDPEGADYKKTALKLGLSQSSIRDYVQRMIVKGIPITKEKLNNKKIILHISSELKKIATLSTIIKLREI